MKIILIKKHAPLFVQRAEGEWAALFVQACYEGHARFPANASRAASAPLPPQDTAGVCDNVLHALLKTLSRVRGCRRHERSTAASAVTPSSIGNTSGTEFPFVHRALQVLIGRYNDPEIDPVLAQAAQASHLFFFQYRQ
jgi:hypothetical protein